MKKLKIHFAPILLLVVFFFTFLISVVSPFVPKASAAGYLTVTQNKTRMYSAVTALMACVGSSTFVETRLAPTADKTLFYTTIAGENLNTFRWKTDTLVSSGYTLGDDGDGDGREWCDSSKPNFMESARINLGYDNSVSFLKDLGFTTYSTTSGTEYLFTNGLAVSDYIKSDATLAPGTSTGGTDEKLSKARAKIADLLSAKIKTVATSKGTPLTLTKPMEYVLAVDAFKAGGSNGCRAKTTLFSDLGTGQEAYPDTRSGTKRKIKMVDDNGTVQDYGVDIQNIGGKPAVYPGTIGGSTYVTCSDLSNLVTDLAPQVATAAAAETADKSAAAENDARIAAAGVYAATLCKDVGGSAPIGSASPQEACAAAVLKCLQPYTKIVTVKVGTQKISETITYNATPEEIDPDTFGQCIFDAKVTKLTVKQIVKAISENKGEADKAAAAARSSSLTDECSTDNTPTYCADVTGSGDGCPMDQDTFMRWMGCGLITLTSGIVNTLYSSIKSLLYTPAEAIFTPDFKKVVDKFRIFGMGLILIAGLIMVIAQATGSDLVDAYTVRKVLPRLAFAIVGMALAWPLLMLVIGLTNDLGLLAGSFIANVGGGTLGGTEANIPGAGLNFILGLPIVFFSVVVRLGWAGFSLLGTAALALALGLLVLAIRQLVVIVLVLLAPLAIAASVLPGTDKLWKFWKNTLITTLAMFPIIMLFLKSGEFFARIANQMQGDQWAIIGIIAYFAPYFMLPFAFKMAGGLMSNIFGIVNDRGKGMFDRLRNSRAEAWKNRKGRASGNRLWDPNSRLVSKLKLNEAASFMTSPGSNIAYYGRKRIPFLSRYGEGVASSVHAARVDHSTKLAQKLAQDHHYNDRAFRVLSGAHDGLSQGTKDKLAARGLLNKRIQTVDQLRTVAQILSESQGEKSFDDSAGVGERNAANSIMSSIGTIATAYQNPEMMKADIAAAGIIGLASAGYADGHDIAGAANVISGDKREDKEFAQSVMAQAVNAGSRGHPELRAGYGPIFDTTTNEFVDGLDEDRAKDIATKLGMHDIADAKPDAFTRLEKGFAANLKSGDENKVREQKDKLFSWAGQYSSAKGDFKEEVLKFIKAQGLAEEFARYSPINPEKMGGLPDASATADAAKTSGPGGPAGSSGP